LRGFDHARLVEAGKRVRAIYPTKHPERMAGKANDGVLDGLAIAVAGKLGGKVGVAPRLFLKKLVAMLDKVEEHASFDPAVHWQLQIAASDMTAAERDAAGIERSVDDIQIELGTEGDGGGGEAG
jgi:hypothetical protein